MIPNEAVEAAARAIWRLERENHAHAEPFNKNWYAGSARAALEAALPHLLASQGCGTGHSGEQLEPAVGATAALANERVATAYYDGFIDGIMRQPWPSVADWAALQGQAYAKTGERPPFIPVVDRHDRVETGQRYPEAGGAA